MIRKILFLLCSIVCLHAAAQTQPETGIQTDSMQVSSEAADPNVGRERIINFHSDITIDSTGLVKVAEHIKVYATGDHIVHGIVRFIPLYRKDKFGNRKKVDFEITSIRKNGQTENYKTGNDGDNRKIYAGQADVTLQPGTYDYVITYQSHGHVGFFDTYDELYWNVTGNEWDFDIEKASATISFPKGATPGNMACYTGVAGSTSKNCNSVVNADNSVTFTASGSLNGGEGFTVAAAFTPNIIKRPGFIARMYNDYLGIIAGIVMVLLFAWLYYKLWNKYGRDPEKPVVIPTFHIPNGWSPALIRYFHSKLQDDKGTAAALINMAVKGAVKITSPEDGSTSYKFEKLNDHPQKLAEEEQAFFDELLGSREFVNTTQTYVDAFVKARQRLYKSVDKQLKLADYYTKNNKPAIWTSLLTIVVLIGYLSLVGDARMLAILFILPFIVIGISTFIRGIKSFKSSIGAGIFLVLFGGLFSAMPLYVATMFLAFVPPAALAVVLIMAAMYVVFISTIRAYTPAGIKIESDIEGFKLYLSTAEEHRLDLLNPPEHTPEVFEKFLPYAIALDLENAWGAKFQAILEQASYNPDWYSGQNISYYVFVSSMAHSSFYRSVNIAPLSSSSGSSSGSSGSSSWSSGSSGGGSSGGGGGGGGGGGW